MNARRRCHVRRPLRCVGLLAVLLPSLALSPAIAADRLATLSLEELGQVEITSVSKRAERLSDAPTAVFVITAADIRRAGVTSLPEALRLAPNLHVARTNNSDYAITARGFAGATANKLLVLIDGRSVYSPLFSGVFWDAQDLMLEDVQRIEVISGPGGTLWGVNAVNGVINVITRPTSGTGGGFAAVVLGSAEHRASLRWGGAAGHEGSSYRVYATRSERRHTENEAGQPINDAGRHSQAGFRADWQQGRDSLMVKGAVYDGQRDQPRPGTISISTLSVPLGPISIAGANLSALWERVLTGGGSLAVQAYYDGTRRKVQPTLDDTQHTVDVQFQHALGPHGAHLPVWGVQLREGQDRVASNPYFIFLPESLNQTWLSLFAQDEITLQPQLHLTLGGRIEHNDYTGAEFLPTARLAWKPTPQHLWWSALSRSVRAPSRLDRDPRIPGVPPYVLQGGPDVQAEIAHTLELGYRGQVAPEATFSATLFHSRYDKLRTRETFAGGSAYNNRMKAATTGLELWGSLQAGPGWRLHAGFTRLHQQLELKPGSNDLTAPAIAAGTNPARWWLLRSALDVGRSAELDATLRYVDTLNRPFVPSYHALDLRLGWRTSPTLEWSVVGHNLLGSGHGEFASAANRTHVEPAVQVKLEARF